MGYMKEIGMAEQERQMRDALTAVVLAHANDLVDDVRRRTGMIPSAGTGGVPRAAIVGDAVAMLELMNRRRDDED